MAFIQKRKLLTSKNVDIKKKTFNQNVYIEHSIDLRCSETRNVIKKKTKKGLEYCGAGKKWRK